MQFYPLFRWLNYCLLMLPLTVTGCAEITGQQTLKQSNWIPSNYQLLSQPIDLKHCIDEQHRLRQKSFTVKQIGILLHPNPLNIRTQAWEIVANEQVTTSAFSFKSTEIGISLIPYLIDEKGERFLIVPRLPVTDFNRFLPACQPSGLGFDARLYKVPYYYPTLILAVAQPHRNTLIDFLKTSLVETCPTLELTPSPIAVTDTLHKKPLSHLLNRVIQPKQVALLNPFPAEVEVALAGTDIKFLVNKPKQPIVQTQTEQITLKWPKTLGNLKISTCRVTEADTQYYIAHCAFKAGQVYPILPSSPQITPPDNARKLVVIALSAALDVTGHGKTIQNALLTVFKSRPKGIFTLLAIGPGRQLSHPVLKSEELAELLTTPDTLQARMKQLHFSAHDLNALDDLELVDVYMTHYQIPVSQVIYLTDNWNMLVTPPRKQLGVPLAWQREGIPLTVLTTESCALWQQQTGAHCHLWQDGQSDTLVKLLKILF